jgi:membrane protein YqaA with SNARE-associated domain
VLFEAIGKPLLAFYHVEGTYESLKVQYNTQWGWLSVLAGAVTFLPYKLFTIFSGSVGFSLPLFVAVSVIGRGLRFFLVAALLYFFGEPIRDFIEKRLTLLFVIFVILLMGGFAALKWLS